MTPAQRRLLDIIRRHGDVAEYWPVMNDWVRDAGRAKSLALHNINRTVDALLRAGLVTLDDDGLFHLREDGR
jgi:predicted transcriptional regulator